MEALNITISAIIAVSLNVLNCFSCNLSAFISRFQHSRIRTIKSEGALRLWLWWFS